MKARDVMTSPVVTVTPATSVKEVARLFLECQISAVPVVDEQGTIVGIVSEGDSSIAVKFQPNGGANGG